MMLEIFVWLMGFTVDSLVNALLARYIRETNPARC